MKNHKQRENLSNLYGFFMESNFHRSDEDILSQLEEQPDSQIEDFLSQIKKKQVRLKALKNKLFFDYVNEKLTEIRQKGLEELRKIIPASEQIEFAPLFSKYQELSESDYRDIVEDQDFLKLMEYLQDKEE
ncbi:hypothetical protein [Chryseobacterium bernardetii]|uniref:hypothetical protein n=1 Tax=Chryseobacterium bernardetii TaxID=1241978 RepID=UPI00162462CF|nr:hypothetical protein [Chryseobacterium bernardetii]